MNTLSEMNSVGIEAILEPLKIRGFKSDQVFLINFYLNSDNLHSIEI